jgi:hypothetical protein
MNGGKVGSLDALAWSCLPTCPADPRRAERAVLAAARRLNLGSGPYEAPEPADELASRRRGQTS